MERIEIRDLPVDDTELSEEELDSVAGGGDPVVSMPSSFSVLGAYSFRGYVDPTC